jgi:hypothetical protein
MQSSGEVWQRQCRRVNPPRIYRATPRGHSVPKYRGVGTESQPSRAETGREVKAETQTASENQPGQKDFHSRGGAQEQPPPYRRYEHAGDEGAAR